MKHRLFHLLVIARDTAQWLFCAASALLPPYRPRRGITLVGYMRDGGSLSKVMRDLAINLKKTGIPYQTFDLGLCNNISLGDAENALTPLWKFRARRFDHVIEMQTSPFPIFHNITYATIIFWEFEDGLFLVHPHLQNIDKTVIAMSEFNAKCYRHELPSSIPVVKINYPLILKYNKDSLPPIEETRQKFGIPSSAFVVFFNFGLGSNRKNPEGCMRAFAEAFNDRSDTCLVFKTMFAKRFPEVYEWLRRLANELGIANRFITITDYLSEHDIYALTNASDVYLSLHRGEGFGLGVAEAMSLAKPAVVTDYSSTTEFCNATNAVPIPFSMIPPVLSEFDRSVYRHVTRWADPDIHAAARALRTLYDDRKLCQSLGEAAAASIAQQYSTEAFKTSILKFLNQN